MVESLLDSLEVGWCVEILQKIVSLSQVPLQWTVNLTGGHQWCSDWPGGKEKRERGKGEEGEVREGRRRWTREGGTKDCESGGNNCYIYVSIISLHIHQQL